MIIGEWINPGVALNGLGLNLFLVKNPQIVDGLIRRNLMDLEATRVEVCYWNDFWTMLAGQEETTDLKNPERLEEILRQNPSDGPEIKFLNVKGRPHPDLVPLHLRPPRR
jgi:hypothetical protein